MSVTVTLHIFSGRPNPSWELSRDEIDYLIERLAAFRGRTLRKPIGTIGGLGYQGFQLHAVRESGLGALTIVYDGMIELDRFSASLVDDKREIENWLLATAGNKLDEKTRALADGEISAVIAEPAARRAEFFTAPPYDPGKWNNDYVVLHQNNCYNYANDKITNTFAQPGRGSGTVFTTFDCANVGAASKRDGLLPVTDASGNPGQGFFAALVMYPGVDFHWYRLDSTGTWSHKPGETPARNVDNKGKIINDPRTCDRGNYTDFCAFSLTIPGMSKIQ